MALGATVHSFQIALDDADRGVHEALEIRVARHPSETAEYLVARLLAYCLEYAEGLEFSRGGLSDPDAPALAIRDLTGALQGWIDIGTPEPARLHKAAKAARRVAVYSHKDVEPWLARLAGQAIHRAAALEIYALDRELVAALAAGLDRRMRFDLVVSDRQLYLTLGERTLCGAVTAHRL